MKTSSTLRTVLVLLSVMIAAKWGGDAARAQERANKPTLVVETAHTGPISTVAFSPDGQHVASASADKTIAIWDVTTGQQVRTITGLGEQPVLTFSPDGQRIASSGQNKTVKIWDVSTGRADKTLNQNTEVFSVAFSPDGRWLASGGRTEVNLWEVATGQLRWSAIAIGEADCGGASGTEVIGRDARSVNALAFSPDGRQLASGGWDCSIKVWDASSGQQLFKLSGHVNGVHSIAFSRDGSFLASSDGTVTLWDLSSKQKIRDLKGGGIGIVLSRDGRWLASLDERGIKIWEVGAWDKNRTLNEDHRFISTAFAFSPDSRLVASVGVDVDKAQHRKPNQPTPDNRLLGSVDVDIDVGSNYQIRIWDFDTGREARTMKSSPSSRINAVAFSPDDRWLAVGDESNEVKIWDLTTGREARRIKVEASLRTMAFDPASGYLALPGAQGTIRFFDVVTGEAKRTLRGNSAIDLAAMAFSRDGHWLAAANPLTLWDLTTGRIADFFKTGEVSTHALAFSPDGYSLAFGLDDPNWGPSGGSIVVLSTLNWNEFYSLAGEICRRGITGLQLADGKIARGRFVPPPNVESLAFGSDGRLLISALSGSDGSGVEVWDFADGHEHQILNDADPKALGLVRLSTQRESTILLKDGDAVLAVAFGKHGHRLATAGKDRSVRLWDADAAREIESLNGHADDVTALSFSHDDRLIASVSKDGTTRIWNAETRKGLCSLVSFREGGWVAVDPEGRFDAENLEEIRGLHWIMPDDPMKALPLEIFMRDYYEPRLLPRLLGGETFKQTRNLSDLNRVQPQIKIASVERQKGKPGIVTVMVEVGKATGELKQGTGTIKRETGVYDLRLFRDGQIVGQYTDGKPQALPQSVSDKEKLLAWRNEAQVKLGANGKRTIKFENIKLPRKADVKQVEFSAYAFNEDRVKSQTDRKSFDIPADLATRRGRAYIISVGVNACDNPAFDLKYSVNDARAIQQTISDRLSKIGDYSEVVQVPLISDYEVRLAGRTIASHDATKEELVAGQKIVTSKSATRSNLKAVLEVLSGKRKPTELPDSASDAEELRKQLQQAQPEDLVLISFSSHGYADSDGNFYFVLSDTGPSTDENMTERLLKKLSVSFLSSEELSLWLREVDAGEMVMVIDACHSAAFTGKEFKPGPMGSRGLGQLSYDKGMRILTATQASDVAYGIGALKQGLLTYVLVKDGIEDGKADFKPVDRKITVSEWLEYGEQGVPKLLEEAGKRAKQADAPVELKDLVQKTLPDMKTQRPSLFDFSRKRKDALLVRQ